MADKFVKASKSFNTFLKLAVKFYLNRIFQLEYDIKNISDLKPPYFVIANHVNFWDPFIVSLCVPEPIYFIASDAYFRSRILKRLLRLVGAIPKIKFVNDAKAIRSVLEVRKNNGIIGLFPEGRRNWDGRTLPLLHASAKLVKSMKIPVVSLRLEGACLAFPRWAAKPRKGKIKVVGSLLLDCNTLPEITVDQIYEKMTQALENDEYGRQRQQLNIYKGKRLAERLELFLFTCPHCHAIGSMKSNNDTFECKECGYKVRYDEYGFIKRVNKDNMASAEDSNISEYFDTTQEWNNWQLGYLTQFIAERIKYIDVPLFQDTGISVFTGEQFKPLRPVASGNLALYPDRLVFKGNSGFSLTCPISHINGENIQFNNRLEFYCEKVLYRFSRPDKCLSAYKWVKAIEIAKNISNKGEGL